MKTLIALVLIAASTQVGAICPVGEDFYECTMRERNEQRRHDETIDLQLRIEEQQREMIRQQQRQHEELMRQRLIDNIIWED